MLHGVENCDVLICSRGDPESANARTYSNKHYTLFYVPGIPRDEIHMEPFCASQYTIRPIQEVVCYL